MMLKHFFTVLIVLLVTAGMLSGQDLFKRELELPLRGMSQRVTKREGLNAGQSKILFDEKGPGCILHWWLTYNPRPGKWADRQQRDMLHNLRIRVYYDGKEDPDIDLSLGQFFSVLQQREVYSIDNAGIKILPLNALNCYFPIPFEQCRIELENTASFGSSFWVMFDWQQYQVAQITPYRFRIAHALEAPADSAGSLLMAEASGEGFIAGMTKSLIRKDYSDQWYHSGGDMLLLDGEGTPVAIRGIGGEDVFNMSFGVWDIQNDWVGAPVRNNQPYERVMYRVFGPDPIWFRHSYVLRFGTKANDIETVVYYYLDESKGKEIRTVERWELAGPFECRDRQQFEREEFPEMNQEHWPDRVVATFRPYPNRLEGGRGEPAVFPVPIAVPSEHGWLDFTATYRGRQKANGGAQPAQVSAYAMGRITVDRPGSYQLAVAFDDWLKLWVNGALIYSGRHESGFDDEVISVELPKGASTILVKLSNEDNFQWRLWAFNLKLLK